MRVINGIADVDFNVGRISREGPHLVVRTGEGASLPTVVYVEPGDIVAALGALLASPAALFFVLTAPFRRRHPAPSAVSGVARRDDVNNPWL